MNISAIKYTMAHSNSRVFWVCMLLNLRLVETEERSDLGGLHGTRAGHFFVFSYNLDLVYRGKKSQKYNF